MGGPGWGGPGGIPPGTCRMHPTGRSNPNGVRPKRCGSLILVICIFMPRSLRRPVCLSWQSGANRLAVYTATSRLGYTAVAKASHIRSKPGPREDRSLEGLDVGLYKVDGRPEPQDPISVNPFGSPPLSVRGRATRRSLLGTPGPRKSSGPPVHGPNPKKMSQKE